MEPSLLQDQPNLGRPRCHPSVDRAYCGSPSTGSSPGFGRARNDQADPIETDRIHLERSREPSLSYVNPPGDGTHV